MRRWWSLLTALTMAIALLGSGASAHPPYSPDPTVLTEVATSVTGDVVNVAAGIDFGGQAAVVLGEDPLGDAPPNADLGKSLGLELTEIQAYRTGPDAPVTLEWHAAQLDQAPPPEVLRYYWTFMVDGIGYSAQAKTTDFVSAANLGDGEPTTIADNLSSYQEAGIPGFRLRGNCGTVAVLNNCGHVAWVTGEFDTEYNIIRFQLPMDLEKAPLLRPGAVLVPDTNGAYAALQAGADVTQTRDTVAQAEEYIIPEPAANATLLDSAGTVVTATTLTAGEDGRWIGSLSGVAPGTYTLRVNGCFADNCASDLSEIVVG